MVAIDDADISREKAALRKSVIARRNEMNPAVLNNGIIGAKGSIEAADSGSVGIDFKTIQIHGDVLEVVYLGVKLCPAAGQSGNRKGNDESQRKNESKQFLHLV